MDAIILKPGEGRRYDCERLSAVFKADEEETEGRCSVSEWWMEPDFSGVGAHSHEGNDEIFYVPEGEPEFLIGENWSAVGEGAFLPVPAGVAHDFRNPSGNRAGVLNVCNPGGLKRDMPAIVKWFRDNPA